MSKVEVSIFGNLVKIAGEKKTLIEASTLGEVLNALVTKYGEDFESRVYDGNKKPRRFINIYVNGKDIRFLNGLETRLKDNDKISIVPAVGGG